MPIVRRFLTSVVLTLVITLAPNFAISAKADSGTTRHGRLVIDHATVSPGEKGETSVLRLRIVNDGHDTEHLLGLVTPVSPGARLVARISDEETVTMESFGIPADEVLDLRSSSMWVELGPLARRISPGEKISVEMIFVSSRFQIDVHVHGAEG